MKMKTKANFIIAFCCLLFGAATGCKTHQNMVSMDTIPYIMADGYFVRNDVRSQPPVKINSLVEFDSFFGQAATMSRLPTTIDFDRQFVIAVTLPETDVATTLTPVSLKMEDKRLVFSYQVKQGKQMSYTILPLMLIIVDKKYDGDVVLMDVI